MKQRDIIKFEVLQRKFKNMVKERGERGGAREGRGRRERGGEERGEGGKENAERRGRERREQNRTEYESLVKRSDFNVWP